MASDDMDVKEEGKKLTKRQQQGMRDTAEDEEWARKQRTQKGWNKKAASNKELMGIMTTDPNTAERKREMRRDEYLLKTTGDDKRKRKASAALGTRPLGSARKRTTRKARKK